MPTDAQGTLSDTPQGMTELIARIEDVIGSLKDVATRVGEVGDKIQNLQTSLEERLPLPRQTPPYIEPLQITEATHMLLHRHSFSQLQESRSVEHVGTYWGQPVCRSVERAGSLDLFCLPRRRLAGLNQPTVVRADHIRLLRHVLEKLQNIAELFGADEPNVWPHTTSATILYGHPGIGKSLSLYFLLMAAVEAKTPCVFFRVDEPNASVFHDGEQHVIDPTLISRLEFTTPALLLIDCPTERELPPQLWDVPHGIHVVIAASPTTWPYAQLQQSLTYVFYTLCLVKKDEFKDMIYANANPAAIDEGRPQAILYLTESLLRLPTLHQALDLHFDTHSPVESTKSSSIESDSMVVDGVQDDQDNNDAANMDEESGLDGEGCEEHEDDVDNGHDADEDGEEVEQRDLEMDEEVATSIRDGQWTPLAIWDHLGPCPRYATLILHCSGNADDDFGLLPELNAKQLVEGDLIHVARNASNPRLDVRIERPKLAPNFHSFFYEQPDDENMQITPRPPILVSCPTPFLRHLLRTAVSNALRDGQLKMIAATKGLGSLYGIYYEGAILDYMANDSYFVAKFPTMPEAKSLHLFIGPTAHTRALKSCDDIGSVDRIATAETSKDIADTVYPDAGGDEFSSDLGVHRLPGGYPSGDGVIIARAYDQPLQRYEIMLQLTVSSSHNMSTRGMKKVSEAWDKRSRVLTPKRIFLFVVTDDNNGQKLVKMMRPGSGTRKSSRKTKAATRKSIIDSWEVGYVVIGLDQILGRTH